MSGKITGYETYGFNIHSGKYTSIKRFRGEGKPHAGVNTPFILEIKSNKGIGSKPKTPRNPEPWELPYGYK